MFELRSGNRRRAASLAFRLAAFWTAGCLLAGGAGETGRSLRGSDLEEFAGISLFLFPGTVEVRDSDIVVLSEWTKAVAIFDLRGELLGEYDWEPEWRPSADRAIASRLPARLRIEADRTLLSAGDTVFIWDGGVGARATPVRFDGPVAIVKALPDRLILEQPSQDTLLGIGDYYGNILRSFGEKLDSSQEDERTNEFFAAAGESEIVVLFKTQPIYRVYSFDGDLLRHGMYAMPPQTKRNHLRINVKAEDDSVPTQGDDELYPIVRTMKLFKGRLHVNFNLCEIGTLETTEFKLLQSRNICKGRLSPPELVAFDPLRDRFLAKIPGRPGIESDPAFRLTWLPISEERPR